MFTGIVKEVGTVSEIRRTTNLVQIGIDCPGIRPELSNGDSVAIDGCDLTVTILTEKGFRCDATRETLSLTTLGDLEPGNRINLEPSLTPSTPISGHFVLGHIDGVGTIRKLEKLDKQGELRISPPPDLIKYIARKGSITVAGVGLTVVDVTETDFSCWIIPYTLENTTLGSLGAGSLVNLEIDVLARYVFRALESGYTAETGKITMDFLRDHGLA